MNPERNGPLPTEHASAEDVLDPLAEAEALRAILPRSPVASAACSCPCGNSRSSGTLARRLDQLATPSTRSQGGIMTTTLTDHLAELATTLNDLRQRFRQAAHDEVARAMGDALRQVALTMLGSSPRLPPPPRSHYSDWDDPWQDPVEDSWHVRSLARKSPSASGAGRSRHRFIRPSSPACGRRPGDSSAPANRCRRLPSASPSVSSPWREDQPSRPCSQSGRQRMIYCITQTPIDGIDLSAASASALDLASRVDCSRSVGHFRTLCVLRPLCPRIQHLVSPEKECPMNAATIANDKPTRKQLSDQLDRLDSILDALSDGLNGAVADAAREGTRLAVKDAIVEIMTDPTLRAKLHQASAETGSRTDSVGAEARFLGAAEDASRSGAEVRRASGRQCRRHDSRWSESGRRYGERRGTRRPGTGPSEEAGGGRPRRRSRSGASFFAPHAVAAALSGISGAVTAAAVQIGVWTRRTARCAVTGLNQRR